MANVLAKEGTGEQRAETHRPQRITRVALIQSIRINLANADFEDAPARDLDEVVAPAFSAAVAKWGKATAYAQRLGVTDTHFYEMLRGERPVPLRACIPLHESAEAMREFCAWWCERTMPQLNPPEPVLAFTKEDFRDIAAELCVDGPLLKLVEKIAKERKGASPEQVAAALIGDRK